MIKTSIGWESTGFRLKFELFKADLRLQVYTFSYIKCILVNCTVLSWILPLSPHRINLHPYHRIVVNYIALSTTSLSTVCI
jgi:hypothetical protein